MRAQSTWFFASLDKPTWFIILTLGPTTIMQLCKKVLIKQSKLSNLNAPLCDLLVLELEWRFSNHELMNVLGIIYSQYWL